ncbi:hypothetical protein B296_00029368 [Ensete ventricosum]|uniref:PEP-utilising enzyme C-terminal domain-containing protein n=1 Tax=Ensete ventricosum TaxID=4639 RepID=A0A426ZLX4_ENSVE|nr:hypothetical protein B296_00029368 [Ensete ventricosum]
MQVMANADTPDDALAAINNGAQGIGLCRTEHMLTEMQVQAILEAAISVSKQGIKVFPEIMVPLIGTPQIAEQAEFFSFGTNDLTQMTFGYSRDDVGKFLPIYLSKGILQSDPFELYIYTFFFLLIQILDQKGVGQLIKVAVERGRRTRPDLKVSVSIKKGELLHECVCVCSEQIGICGEHGGEPSSVAFFAQAGLDYVSCSPFRFLLHSLDPQLNSSMLIALVQLLMHRHIQLMNNKYHINLLDIIIWRKKKENNKIWLFCRVPIARLAAAQVVVA